MFVALVPEISFYYLGWARYILLGPTIPRFDVCFDLFDSFSTFKAGPAGQRGVMISDIHRVLVAGKKQKKGKTQKITNSLWFVVVG